MAVMAPLFGLAGLAVSGVFKKKAKPQPSAVPLPTMTPRGNSVLADMLAARRGSAANQRTGSGGAESSTGVKKSLLGT